MFYVAWAWGNAQFETIVFNDYLGDFIQFIDNYIFLFQNMKTLCL
jgi:hypothetical protein